MSRTTTTHAGQPRSFWPPPENSCSTYLSTTKNKHYWSPQGPVLEWFCSIQGHLHDLMRGIGAYYAQRYSKPTPSYSLIFYMVGLHVITSAPTVICITKVKRFRKLMVKVIEKEGHLPTGILVDEAVDDPGLVGRDGYGTPPPPILDFRRRRYFIPGREYCWVRHKNKSGHSKGKCTPLPLENVGLLTFLQKTIQRLQEEARRHEDSLDIGKYDKIPSFNLDHGVSHTGGSSGFSEEADTHQRGRSEEPRLHPAVDFQVPTRYMVYHGHLPRTSPCAQGTVGGLVQIRGRLYGLTAGHTACVGLYTLSELGDFIDPERFGGDYSDGDDDDDDVEISASELNDCLEFVRRRGQHSPENHRRECSIARDPRFFYAVGTSGTNKIYADCNDDMILNDLKEVQDRARAISDQPGSRNSGLDLHGDAVVSWDTGRLDWVVITLPDLTVSFKDSVDHVLLYNSLRFPYLPALDGKILFDHTVNISTSRGLHKGTLLGCPTIFSPRNSSRIWEVYCVWLDERSNVIEEGDCGSWVQSANQVYGHVVAAGYGGRMVYIMPMREVLDALKKELHVEDSEVTLYARDSMTIDSQHGES
ncbi:hypothetical protein FH972_009484 [Carpinus fangiana]|uniref:Uncharacterized protein n=1 Tax=Carpinus fangiana TaxID=176857 RepID=A0A660KMD8_9ROSI|nr:hypothetical protein FH972_009484 [Carpinus fangiana]